MPRRLLALVLLASVAVPARAQLTVEQITQDPETWIGAWPGEPFWTEAGDAVYVRWNPRGAFPADSLFRIAVDGGDPVQVAPAERRALPPRYDGWVADGRYSPDGRRRVFVRDADVWVYDRDSGDSRRLTRTASRESNARFLVDGSVAFRLGDGLYRLADG
ncbi:MAG: S9 family peptidase, partial [Bacteroidota bacterium]